MIYPIDKKASARLAALLPETCTDLSVRTYPTIDSTNTEARRLLGTGNLLPPALLVAEEQTSGRGRLGRSFYSPAQTGLYMTLVLRKKETLDDVVRLTTMTSVGVARAIEKLTGQSVSIKWVNDLYLADRKVCGILTEALPRSEGGVDLLIGIGINLTTKQFPEELRDVAASLGAEVSRERLAAEVAAEICGLAEDLRDTRYMEEYRRRSMVLGRKVFCLRGNSAREAEAVAITDSGGLVVRYSDGETETLSSGEISIRF